MSLSFVSQFCSDQTKTGDGSAMYSKKCPDNDQNRAYDICTPFCNCSCCGTNITNACIVAADLETPVVSIVKHSEASSSLLSKVSIDFWQPPRVV